MVDDFYEDFDYDHRLAAKYSFVVPIMTVAEEYLANES